MTEGERLANEHRNSETQWWYGATGSSSAFNQAEVTEALSSTQALSEAERLARN
jgi:hypothetical protein